MNPRPHSFESLKALALALVLFVPLAIMAKPREWKSATVVSITSTSENGGAVAAPIGTAVYAIPIRINRTFYRIDTEEVTYILVWINKRRPLNVTLHGQTKISIDGQNAHILDDSGKDIKLPISQKIAKP